MDTRTKKILISTFIVLFALILSLAVYQTINNQHFRLVKSTPKITGTVATSTNGFRLEFNKDLAVGQNYKSALDDPGGVVKRIDGDKRSILIYITSLSQDKNYKFSLNNLRSVSGEVLPSLKFDFKAKYISLDKLSDGQRQLIAQVADQYKKDYPLLSHLPYSTLDFSLNTFFEPSKSESAEVGTPYIQAKLLLSAADARTNPEIAISKYKQEVIDYIKSLGINPNDYDIRFEIVTPSI